MDMQALMDAISAGGRTTRKGYHLTLGKLISDLRSADEHTPVRYDVGSTPCGPHSYRGYYEDLAFEAQDKSTTVSEFLSVCLGANGKTFVGYKGGNFLMDEDAILWASSYGSSDGRAIVGTEMREGAFTILTREVY